MSYRNIKPIRDKKTGEVLSNVEVVKRFYKELLKLKEGDPSDDEATKIKKRAKLDIITNGNTDKVLEWCEQIVNCDDPVVAQNMLANTLIGIPSYSK